MIKLSQGYIEPSKDKLLIEMLEELLINYLSSNYYELKTNSINKDIYIDDIT